MPRLMDLFSLFYFATHIPITIFIDSQALFPSKYYPEQIVQLFRWYAGEFKDCLMVNPPPWFLSFVICEMTVQFPFFFVALHAFLKGVKSCPWIRIPVMVYSAHVITTLIAILTHLWLADFSQSKHPGPSTVKERLTLMGIYSIYFFAPLFILLDAAFSSAYHHRPSVNLSERSNKKKR